MKTFILFALFTLSFVISIPHTQAINIDPFTFCNNSCKSPSCDEKNVAERCKKICSEDSTWKHVASLQMSSSSKEFRMEKDKTKKDHMLYEAPIAKCVGKVKPVEETHKTDVGAKPVDETAKMKEDLCAAALKKEMNALKHNKADLEAQNRELEAALHAIQSGSQAHAKK